MIRPFRAVDNSVYIWGADVDWRSSMHISNMMDWLRDRDIDWYHNRGTFYFTKERDRTLFLLQWAGAVEFQ